MCVTLGKYVTNVNHATSHNDNLGPLNFEINVSLDM